jgi:energy-coupling factor transporter transmembrane protein EcfT
VFAGAQFGATVAIWFIIYLCTVKSIKWSSYIVWPTVILPFIFLIIFMGGTISAKGASRGVQQYVTGRAILNQS